MTYFSEHDHNLVVSMQSVDAGDLQRLHNRMSNLHRKLYSKFKQHNMRLHPYPAETGGVSHHTNTSPLPASAMTLVYARPAAEALTVERIIGRETMSSDETNIYLHPTIEIRLTPDHLAVELVIAPDARYDQQNFVGKLTLNQHRKHFYQLLINAEEDYLFGFWAGSHLSDLHLNTDQMPPAKLFYEFIDTFAAGRDYLRVGRWFERGTEELTETNIHTEIFKRVRELYDLYDFLLWTSGNNFHTFYEKVEEYV